MPTSSLFDVLKSKIFLSIFAIFQILFTIFTYFYIRFWINKNIKASFQIASNILAVKSHIYTTSIEKYTLLPFRYDVFRFSLKH